MATIISFLEMLGQLELISQLMGKYESPFFVHCRWSGIYL